LLQGACYIASGGKALEPLSQIMLEYYTQHTQWAHNACKTQSSKRVAATVSYNTIKLHITPQELTNSQERGLKYNHTFDRLKSVEFMHRILYYPNRVCNIAIQGKQQSDAAQ